MATVHQTDIVILGCGIGGYETFRTLAKLLRKQGMQQHITVVDQNNFFTFTPLLHEVATGAVEPTHASVPIRELLHKSGHSFFKARVERVDPEKKIVHTSKGEIHFDTCVVGLGSTTNYFNCPGAEEYTHHVRNLRDAIMLQSTVLSRLEGCDECPMNITVVGGGYTGVEIAAEFAQLCKRDFHKLYPNAKFTLSIVHSRDTILPNLPAPVQQRITKRLESFNVQLVLNERVTEVAPKELHLKSGKKLPNDITIWTTGFQTHADTLLPESYCDRGRIRVDKHLRSTESASIYAVGDIALVRDPDDNEVIYPQLGEAAHMEGMYVAKHIVATLRKKKIKPFRFKSHGTLIPVGEWYGVAAFKKIRLYGKVAWWMRRTAYVMFMPGFLRKLRIVLDWTLHSFGFRHIIDLDLEHEQPKKK